MSGESKKLWIVAAFILLFAANGFADGPAALWTRTYGGAGDELGRSVLQTVDGGYIIGGHTNSFGAGLLDYYLIKADADGDTLWTRTYGGSGDDYLVCVQQTSGGGYILIGRTDSFGAGSEDFYLVKTDALGDTIWTRTYGGWNSDIGTSVRQTSDGGYILAGYTMSYGAGEYDVYLIKTDANGDTLWTRTYGAGGRETTMSVEKTTDSGYVIAAQTWSFCGGSAAQGYLLKTDANGDTLWTRLYDCATIPYAAIQTSDGGYIASGWCTGPLCPGCDGYLIKTDASGDTLWTRTYGGADYDAFVTIQQAHSGGYIIVGETQSFGNGSSDVYLVRIDADGDTLWTSTYGGSEYEEGRWVELTSDGGYIVAGTTESFGAGGSDIYLVKTQGHTPVIRRIVDVPGDQGRQVTVSWHRSDYDAPGDTVEIAGYSLWRRIDAASKMNTPYATESAKVPARLVYPPGEWHYVLTVPARGERVYNCVAPTLCDSTSGGNCWSVFFVSAMTPDPLLYFDSAPDSGYSIDNLAPAPPANLRFASPTGLTWDESEEEDFDYFSVYGSETPDFDETAVLIGYTAGTDMDISEDICLHYHVTATDFAGNEGDASSVENTHAGMATDADLPAGYAFKANRPNPFEAETVIQFDMPISSFVSLRVFDAQGRLVETLAETTFPAGRHSVTWSPGVAKDSSIKPGIYFIRMEAGDFATTKKMIWLR